MNCFVQFSETQIPFEEHRRRLLYAILAGIFGFVACSHLLHTSSLMTLAIFVMPGVLYQVVYSQNNPPRSKVLWCLFVLTSAIIYFIFTMFSLFVRDRMGTAEIIFISVITISAMAQIRFLFRVRRQMRQPILNVRGWT